MSKTLTFTSDQLFLLVDAMEGYDIVHHSNNNQDEIKAFEKLYTRVLKALQTAL